LTEEWLGRLENTLTSDPIYEEEIFGGLFVAKRVEIPHEASVGLFGPFKGHMTNAELMLEKLSGDLLKALKQIKTYVLSNDINLPTKMPSKAVVFISGTSSWDEGWGDMWDMLSNSTNDAIREKVDHIYHEASNLVELPFELIIARDRKEEGIFGGEKVTKLTVEYVPFPWVHKKV
jgi:hypothetical protein